MNGTRVVVVLGGGGAKAAAHLGAARAWHEAGIRPIHYIGTSMGAVTAAALATGEEPAAILERFAAIEQRDVLVPERLEMLKGIWGRALLKAAPLRRSIERFLPGRTFRDLPTPCTVTAVEAETGREVAFGTGGEDAPLHEALLAACALPPYFPPIPVNGRGFYDGGLRAVVPLRQAERIACDLVIAVHVGPGFDEQGEPVKTPPPFVQATDRALGWLMAEQVELQRERWDAQPGRAPLLWLRPTAERGATFAMERIPAYAQAGYDAMRRALAELMEEG